MMVTARKYRPKEFSDVFGQDTITEILKKSIQNEKLAQAYLFCGPRGVGKTTLARIFAKKINEFDTESEQFDPLFNIFELDAASNNSVEDIRSLTEQVRIPPQNSKYKVYIIDEVHMLSQSAFNAFLKTLEEPPKHAKFVLATTEKHKIIPTILSRCQIFDFKRISVDKIVEKLLQICKIEKINFEKEALRAIAKESDGSMRDAMFIFDQLTTATDGNLKLVDVNDQLNIIDQNFFFQVVKFMLDNQIDKVISKFDEILNKGYEIRQFILSFSQHFRNLLMSKDVNNIEFIECSAETKKNYFFQSNLVSYSNLIHCLDLCNKADLNYNLSSNKKILVELLLFKLSQVILKKDIADNDTSSNPKKVLTRNKEISSISRIEADDKKILNKKQITESNDLYCKETPKSRTPSINKLSNSDIKLQEESLTIANNDIISTKILENVWKEFLIKLKNEKQTNLEIALSAFNPSISENNEIFIFVSNTSQKELVYGKFNYIKEYLIQSLKNHDVEIIIEVKELDEINKTPYTNSEKFNKMINQNPNIIDLKNKFDLDYDY